MAEQKLSDSRQPNLLQAAPDREEKIFLKEHSRASRWSSILFAVGSAWFIGMLGTLTQGIYNASEESKRLFQKARTPWLMAGMAAIGTACIFASNWLESKKTLLEWRMGGSKVGRKISNAEQQVDSPPASPVTSVIPEQETVSARADGKSWQQSVSGSKKEWERTA